MNRHATQHSPTLNTADRVHAALFSGAIGSAVVALFFLILDSSAGEPLASPGLLGSVLLGGAPVGSAGPLRLELIALFSLVHFTAFAGAGAGSVWVLERAPILADRPLLLGGLIASALTAGLAGVDAALAPGLVSELGIGAVLVGNLMAATAMTAFLQRAWRAAAARLVPVPTPSGRGQGQA